MELVISDRIRNRKVQFFNSFNISLRYNSIASTFSFDFYFDPDVIEQKEMACIGHAHLCQLFHNGQLLLTGQILSEAFSDTPTKRLVAVGGYSLPGVLEDCQVPTDEAIDVAIAAGNLKLSKGSPAKPYAPVQTEGLKLRKIVEKYIAPFNLQMVIDPLVSALMEQPILETCIKPTDTIAHYIVSLAQQKNINVSHNANGQLLFTRVRTNLKPVLEFNVPKGGLPGIKMDLNFDGQHMHSQITVVKAADIDNPNAGQSTITNPFVPFVFRPRTIMQNSGTNTDTELAAKNALAEELKNLRITIAIDRWDINNKVILPNNIIAVTNPEIYLFKRTELFIESIDYKSDQKESTAVLNCCLPEVYNGTLNVEPSTNADKYTFKGINLH